LYLKGETFLVWCMGDKELCNGDIDTKILHLFVKVCPMWQQNIMVQTTYEKCTKTICGTCSSPMWPTQQKYERHRKKKKKKGL